MKIEKNRNLHIASNIRDLPSILISKVNKLASKAIDLLVKIILALYVDAENIYRHQPKKI